MARKFVFCQLITHCYLMVLVLAQKKKLNQTICGAGEQQKGIKEPLCRNGFCHQTTCDKLSTLSPTHSFCVYPWLWNSLTEKSLAMICGSKSQYVLFSALIVLACCVIGKLAKYIHNICTCYIVCWWLPSKWEVNSHSTSLLLNFFGLIGEFQ